MSFSARWMGLVASALAMLATLCPKSACAQLAAVELDPSEEQGVHEGPVRTRAAATWATGPAGDLVPRLEWNPRWRRFETGDAIFTGLMAGAAVATYLSPPSADAVRWQGGILFDDAARSGLALSNPSSRETAAVVSDGIAVGLFALPVLVDALLIGWAGHGSSDVAAQMLLIDLQAHAIAQGLTGIVKWAVRRERPIAASCRESGGAGDAQCEGHIEPSSFFSGHASMAFTSAALVCVHHTELGLIGEGGAAAACASALALAGGVGALRIMADRHYASDVIVGAAVGMVSGWLLPYILHYGSLGGPDASVQAAIAPTISRDQAGLQVVGSF